MVRIWLPRDAPTWEVFKARLGSLAQWEVSLPMAGSWDWMVFKVHPNTLTFCCSQWKADTEQFLNTNVLVSSANPQCSIYEDMLCDVCQVENTSALCWGQLSLTKCSVKQS